MAAQDLNNSFRLNLDNRRPLEVGSPNLTDEFPQFYPIKISNLKVFFRIESYVQSTLIIVDLHMRQNLFRSKSRAVRPPGLQLFDLIVRVVLTFWMRPTIIALFRMIMIRSSIEE